MPLTNTIKRQLDMPDWEWCNFAPIVSGAIGGSTNANNSAYHPNHGRYVFYLINATNFWCYDTWFDSWEQLQTPPVAPATYGGMKYLDSHGYQGRVLAAGASTMTIPAFYGQALLGYDVNIVSGTGAGQKRVIKSVAEPVIAAQGAITAITNTQGTINITDTNQAWTINQWRGYQVRITFGSGVGQVRKILYNSATVLYLGDSTKSADDIYCNPGVYPTAPAVGSIYAIESTVVTVDTAWATQPDTTSRFRVESGAVMLVSSAAAAPFYTIQQYDIASDTWYVRTSGSNMVAAVAAEASVEHAGDVTSSWVRGVSSIAGTTTTLVDSTQNWAVNQWAGYWVFIFSGTGAGQLRQIASNTISTLTWTTAGTAPDLTSQYLIIGYTAGTVTTGSATTITDSAQAWATNQWANYAVKILYGTGAGQVSTIASNTATALTLTRPFLVATDTTSVYAIVANPDIAYSAFSANAPFVINNLEDDLPTLGRLYDAGTACVGSAILSSQANAPLFRGSTKPQSISGITFVTTTATATTVNNHNFVTGDVVVIAGVTGANAATYNGTFTITGVPSLTTFTYTMGGTPSANAVMSTAQSTTTLTDTSKNWTTNQWAGYLVTFNSTAVTGTTGAATCLTAVITSNTANTLTFSVAAATAPTSGTSRYVITPNRAIGTSNATGTAAESGVATSGSTTTIVVSTGTWQTNIFTGRRVRFTGGAGQGQEVAITSNTATTLTFAAQGTAAAAGTTFSILQQGARGTGARLLLAFNQLGPGNPGYAVGGLNPSNPNTVIAAQAYPQVPKAQYLFIARGGATYGFDRFDVTTDQGVLLPVAPQIETLTAGSSYAYDGFNRLYFTKIDAVNTQHRIYYLDLLTYHVHGAGIPPYTIPTATVGNRMETFTTYDGTLYLWLQRNSFQETFRTILGY